MDSYFHILMYIPLIAFVVIDATSSTKKAVLAGTILAVVVYIVSSILVGSFDFIEAIIMFVLVLMGIVSYIKADSLYFKLQPAVLNILFALYISYWKFFNMERFYSYLDAVVESTQMKDKLPDNYGEIIAVFLTPMIIALILHAAIMVWAARRKNNIVWIVTKALGLPIIIGFSVVYVKLFTEL